MRKLILAGMVVAWSVTLPSNVGAQDPLCAISDLLSGSAELPGRTLLFPDRPEIRHDAGRYLVGVALGRGDAVDRPVLVVLNQTQGAVTRLIFTETFETLLSSVDPPRPRGCRLVPIRPWLSLRILDLDGNGRAEIVLESNESGTCPRCTSTVRVYQIDDGGSVRQVLKEPYSRIALGTGEGLVVTSFVQGVEPIPVTKLFFVRMPEKE